MTEEPDRVIIDVLTDEGRHLVVLSLKAMGEDGATVEVRKGYTPEQAALLSLQIAAAAKRVSLPEHPGRAGPPTFLGPGSLMAKRTQKTTRIIP